jgi:iron complex outermembrane receptor protein
VAGLFCHYLTNPMLHTSFKSFVYLGFFMFFGSIGFCQDSTGNPLREVIIKAYEQGKKLKDVPASVNYVGKNTLERFNPVSIVQPVNSTPGVRMEERSPGSYRFNIRGSSLRSPFGVRNVKVYYNDIPITDPGGNTYLNQLGYYNFNSLELIKGPGSSLYGAGTGGVLLIESLGQSEQPSFQVNYTTGSFGLHNVYGSIVTGRENYTSRVGFQHQESSGYRDHSKMKRDVHSWNARFRFGEHRELKTTFLYGNLFYETPGALTKAEYDVNPKAARPGSGAFPGAETAQASITQKTFIAGASYDQQLLPKWQNKSVLYGMFTELRNPSIQSYGRNSEPHVGGRTTFRFSQPLHNAGFTLDMGGEFQEGFSTFSIFKNVGGNADSLRTYDEVNTRQSFLFSQAVLDLPQWTLTAGGSLNFLRVNFQRFSPASLGRQKRTFSNQVAPRFAVLRKFNSINVYASIGKGFSPPTTGELAPTGGAVNLELNAEKGINYDLGVKGSIGKKVYVDVTAFLFALENTIVLRRTAGGGDFYLNAGKTKQHGVETFLSYSLLPATSFTDKGVLWISYTWHDFHYKEFKQVNNDFSGNQMPSVAPHTVSSGFDFSAKNGLIAAVGYYFCGKIPLNDANSEYAAAYHLLSIKLGFEKWYRQKIKLKFMAGADNLLDQQYSLGNDINGFGGRYYNAAPSRNYYAGIAVQLNTKKFQ